MHTMMKKLVLNFLKVQSGCLIFNYDYIYCEGTLLGNIHLHLYIIYRYTLITDIFVQQNHWSKWNKSTLALDIQYLLNTK